MTLGLLIAAVTLYVGDENAAKAAVGAADAKVVSFAGATTDALIEKIDGGALDGIAADAVELFIGMNNTRTRPCADESPLDTVLGAKDIAVRLRRRYPKATIALNPIPYAKEDGVADQMRNFEVNCACIEINEISRDGTEKMFLRQPDWMFKRPAPSKWKAECTPMTPYIKKYWLDNQEDPRLKLKRREQRARATGLWDCVMLGDSVTHFWELHNGAPYFNANLRDRWRIFNLGFGGDCTQNTIWNLLNSGYVDGCRVKMFTVLIGNNNIGEKTTDAELADVARGCRRVLDIIRDRHPESKIILFPLLPKGNKPGVFRGLHAKYNDMIRRFADGKTVIWAGELWDAYIATADADGVIPKDVLCDGCHPGSEGYRIWGEVLTPYLKRFCK